ncbi:hypothetical protein Tco_0079767 [Tanacetum coccineum]
MAHLRQEVLKNFQLQKELQADCDLKATNIVLQGLPPDAYAIFNHHKVVKEIWDRVKLLMQGTQLSLQDKECKLYGRGLVVLVFNQGDDLIACLNKEMAFLIVVKAMLAEAQESGQILDEEQLAFLADPGIPDGQDAKTTIPNNAAFQIEDLDAYDSDCDDVSNAKAVLMANLSNYGSDIISEVPHSETYHNDMDNQSVHAM